MLIVPLTGKLSWRNPPAITAVIILINCLVYFLWQADDMQRLYKAELYYFDSGLAQIEIPLYLKYRTEQSDAPPPAEGDLDEAAVARAFQQMEADVEFLQLLHKGRIVTGDNPQYRHWRHLRRNYNHMLEGVVTLQYGFRPAYPSVHTFFTYMFLHGSFGHLLGNMIFLWIVGCVLEVGCGRFIYIGVYVLGGLFAVILYGLVYSASTVPLVGASGAIAGLMGAFTVLFGKKKVSIFYSLGFYFNYLKMPAITLLPIWIGKELFQLLYGSVRHVAYVAHIGGLVTGALLGFFIWRYFKLSNKEIFSEDLRDEIAPLLEQAFEKIGELDLDNARLLLYQVLEKDPDNLNALNHLFNIEKHDADNQRFHDVAKRLLIRVSGDLTESQRAYGIYADYLKHAYQPKLPAPLYLRLSTVCIATGHLDHAAKILANLIKKRSDLPGLSTALLKLANCYRQSGNSRQYDKCLRVLTRNFPQSPEAKIAQKTINQ
jgi:membrane associated rhomboid family serine protease